MIKTFLSLVGVALLFFWIGIATSYIDKPYDMNMARALTSLLLGAGFILLTIGNILEK